MECRLCFLRSKLRDPVGGYLAQPIIEAAAELGRLDLYRALRQPPLFHLTLCGTSHAGSEQSALMAWLIRPSSTRASSACSRVASATDGAGASSSSRQGIEAPASSRRRGEPVPHCSHQRNGVPPLLPAARRRPPLVESASALQRSASPDTATVSGRGSLCNATLSWLPLPTHPSRRTSA